MDINQGATLSIPMVIEDEAGLIDLTGHTFQGQIRATISAASPLVSFSFTIANQLTDRGRVTIQLTDTQTSSLPAPTTGINRNITQYVYDIESVSPGGIRTRWLQGLANVSPEVTR